MNERIKQLAEQAYEDVIKNTPSFLVTKELYEQKFAELIVQECADICYHHSNAAGGVDTHFGYGYKDCGDDIKRNFGVKK